MSGKGLNGRREAIDGSGKGRLRHGAATFSGDVHHLFMQVLDNLEVRFSDIPEHPDGFIPFARVEHAKYLTVDGDKCWIGTSNWSRGYFYESRNLGLFLVGDGAAHDPDLFFNQSWHGPYAATVDPGADYEPPRRN